MTTETAAEADMVTISKVALDLLLTAAEILSARTTDGEVEDDMLADMMIDDGLLVSRQPTDAEIEDGEHIAGDGSEFDSFVEHSPKFLGALDEARAILYRKIEIETDMAVYTTPLPAAGSFSD